MSDAPPKPLRVGAIVDSLVVDGHNSGTLATVHADPPLDLPCIVHQQALRWRWTS